MTARAPESPTPTVEGVSRKAVLDILLRMRLESGPISIAAYSMVEELPALSRGEPGDQGARAGDSARAVPLSLEDARHVRGALLHAKTRVEQLIGPGPLLCHLTTALARFPGGWPKASKPTIPVEEFLADLDAERGTARHASSPTHPASSGAPGVEAEQAAARILCCFDRGPDHECQFPDRCRSDEWLPEVRAILALFPTPPQPGGDHVSRAVPRFDGGRVDA